MPRLLLNREHNDETSLACQLVTWSCKAASVASVTCDLCCSSLMQLVGMSCFSFVTLTDSMKVIKGRMGGANKRSVFFPMSTLGCDCVKKVSVKLCPKWRCRTSNLRRKEWNRTHTSYGRGRGGSSPRHCDIMNLFLSNVAAGDPWHPRGVSQATLLL